VFTVLRIERRLDRHMAPVESVRQRAAGDKLVEHSVKERGILGVKAHVRLGSFNNLVIARA
jgi:hypothetical protein